MKRKRIKRLSSFQQIILGFVVLILVGAILLMLPISSQEHVATPFMDALFTSTSAACVTGLIVKNTAEYWSVFGKCIIITLIQIGGLGVVSMFAGVMVLSGAKISLSQRGTIQEALATHSVGGVVRFVLMIFKGTAIIELLGAVGLMISTIPKFGINGIWIALFHSISAFCNAGFDLYGSSLTGYTDSILVNIVIMLLIIIGGIGFLTWLDIKNHKHQIKKYSMQSKTVLTTSAILIVIPAIIFFLFEFTNLPVKSRILASIFQSVTTRTAGFNSVPLENMSTPSQALMIFLMLIGGSPGSTAGGMKTATLAVLVASAWSIFSRKSDTEMFGRRISEETIRHAVAILVMYVMLSLGASLAIGYIENIDFSKSTFEVVSAISTIGLTLDLTSKLHMASRIILIVLMFFGRVGGLTLIYAASQKKNNSLAKLPLDKITVG